MCKIVKSERLSSLLSPRPLPAPFDSPHLLLSWEVSTWRFGEQIARSKKTPALQAIVAVDVTFVYSLYIW